MPSYKGFIGASNTSQSILASCEQTFNWYFEPLPQFGKNYGALYPSPGFSTFATTTDVNTRGGLTINGRTFAIIGPTLYEVDANGVTTNRGTMAQDANPAQITANMQAGTAGQLFIASGGNGYCYDLDTNILTIELTGDCTQAGMLDGYFIAFDLNTNTIRISDLNDGTTWDPTQFAQNSITPDPWQSMLVVQQPAGIWLLGESNGQVWYDAGTFPFPFQLIAGATFRFGIVAPFCIGLGGNRVTWLSQNDDGAALVVSATGYTPQRISTYEVERAIETYSRDAVITDAEMLTYQQEGHTFNVITFPSANATWCYDQSIPDPHFAWTQRGKWNSVTGQFDFWRPRVHIAAFGGKHIVGDRETGILSNMDTNLYTEVDGSAIRRVRRGPGINKENYPFVYRRFELYLETGIGVLSGQGSNPKVFLRISDDGGQTWSPELQASAGSIGAFGQRVYWTRLGIAIDRVFEVSVSDPVPWRLINAWINNDNPQPLQAAS